MREALFGLCAGLAPAAALTWAMLMLTNTLPAAKPAGPEGDCQQVLTFRNLEGRAVLVRTLDVQSLTAEKTHYLLTTSSFVIESRDEDLHAKLMQALTSCGVRANVGSTAKAEEGN